NESTRFTDGSGAVSPQRRGLRTNRTVLRQGQGPAAAGRYQRLVRAIGGTGHCAGPFSFWAGLSAFVCKADIDATLPNVCYWHKADIRTRGTNVCAFGGMADIRARAEDV